jgi:hypothetical protein
LAELLIVFQRADEVLDRLATFIKAIERAVTDQNPSA